MILFWFKEAFKLIGRSKFSFLLSLVSITFSVLLITLSFLIVRFSDHFESQLKSNITISVFIKDSIQPSHLDSIKSQVSAIKYFSKSDYIDKEKAVDIFIKETGDDFRKILDYNPLPASFNLTLKSIYAENDSINKVVKFLSELDWVDEVVFRQDFYQKILTYIDQFKIYLFAITGLIFFVSLYLVYSTVKLILSSKYSELETMKFVGAKLSTIKMPIILNSILTGALSGFLSLGIYWIAYIYIKKYFIFIDQILLTKIEFILLLMLIGPVIGLIVTYLSLRKISLKI